MAIYCEKAYPFACLVQLKGLGDGDALNTLCRWFLEVGLTQTIRHRSDEEPAIQSVAQTVARRREQATIVELAPTRTNGGLGSLNRFCESLGGELRALLMEAEERLKIHVALRSKAFAALVRHAAWLMARLQQWHVGHPPYKTPFE